MSIDWKHYANSSLNELTPYQPGKPIQHVMRTYGLRHVIKLASNENPLGSSPAAEAAALTATKQCAYYPESDGFPLRQALAKHLNTSPDKIILGAGSEQVIAYIAAAFSSPDDEIIMSQYAFATYKIIAQVLQSNAIITPAKQWKHDLSQIQKSITEKTRLIILANPNNPTGTWCTHAEIHTFLKHIPSHVVVILDEAYYEYAYHHKDYPNSLSLQNEFPNLVITRTFSKIYGLAGLRIGYGVVHHTMTEVYDRVRLPFNITSPALAAAKAALHDQDHVQASLANNTAGLMQLKAACQAMKLPLMPHGLTNFITIQFSNNAQKICESLLRKGIIVRPLLNYGLIDHLRVTIGTPSQNEALITTLATILKQ